MGNKIGAPKGGRVHWLLESLTPDFLRAYNVNYDYLRHRYAFSRFTQNRGKKRIIDVFIVVRTSKRCFRVSYVNYLTNDIQYFSCYKSCHVARRLWTIWKMNE